jgi:hypothetical protein
MAARRTDAENRRLFQRTEPLQLTIAADFKAVNADRSENSTKRFPATLAAGGDEGGPPMPVTLRTRGHFRRRSTSCAWVPLRVEFQSDRAASTVFEHQRTLKLVTHCRDNGEYEQYVLREYLVYRLFNLLTPRSFRARLVKATYADAASGRPLTTRYGMFVEDDDDVARRNDARVIDLERALFKDVDADSVTLMMLFEYMVGSTDFSIFKLHNVRLLQDQNRAFHTVPYDFDLTGLVNTRYAVVDSRLPIDSVRSRLYRGPCRTESELQPLLDRFRATRDAALALYDSLPDLDPAYRRSARGYLQEFYSLIDVRGGVKKALVDGCSRAPTM